MPRSNTPVPALPKAAKLPWPLCREWRSAPCTERVTIAVPVLFKGGMERQPAQILLALTEPAVKAGMPRSPCSALSYTERKVKGRSRP